MKNYKYLTIAIALIVSLKIQGQDFNSNLDNAKSLYKSGNLDEARYALQQALNDINVIIGKKILELLPVKMGGLDAILNNDQSTTNSIGFAGLIISRNYGTEEAVKTAKIDIVTDSPLLAGINAILAMPQIAGFSDPNQKRIQVDGYKALMQKNVNEDGSISSYDVQIPFDNSLLTFTCTGFSNDNDVIAMVNFLPVSKISQLTK